MGIFDGYLMCVDFDGTVALNGKIVPENADAIRYFEEEGGRFTICTGRPAQFMYEAIAPTKLNAPLLCMNGTILYDMEKQEMLRCWTAGRELWECCEELITRYPDEITRVHYYPRGGEDAIWRRGESELRELYPRYDLPLYKVIVVVTTEASDRMLREIQEQYGEQFAVSRSWVHGIELQARDSDKGVAVNTLRRMLGDIHTVVCAGDYENDIPMLRVADISYAVGNATPAVKAAATRQTIHCQDGAIAAIIEELAGKGGSRVGLESVSPEHLQPTVEITI